MSQKQEIYDTLDKLKIPYESVEHEPVFTMEDMDKLGLPEKGCICKNLFLRDAKGKRHFLITLPEDKQVDLKQLSKKIGSTTLSFASAERLDKYLGLKQGSVTPFGLINDKDHAVEMFFDQDLAKAKRIGIHPCDNTATVFLTFKDLEKFLFQLDVDAFKLRI